MFLSLFFGPVDTLPGHEFRLHGLSSKDFFESDGNEMKLINNYKLLTVFVFFTISAWM